MSKARRSEQEPQRTVKAAVFDGDLGPFTAAELMSLPEEAWGHLRDLISDRRAVQPENPLARCLLCKRGVFIRVQALGEQRLPMLVHFAEPGLNCEWHRATTIHPDAARAAQYAGQQESELHRNLCEAIARLLQADPRCKRTTVGQYHPPTESEHGRYPDVYAELEGLPPVTLELQLSRTLAPEIAGRGVYYQRERVGLIWVLYGISPDDANLPQSFRDVIRRHRGNAFLFDRAAAEASAKAGTLVLRCLRRKKSDDAFYAPKLVRLDELTFPDKGLPFFEDCRTPALLEPAERAREKWFDAIAEFDPKTAHVGMRSGAFSRAWDSLRMYEPTIAAYKRELYSVERFAKDHIISVLLILFSIARTGFDGRERNLATAHSGKGSMVAMLNTRLHAAEFQEYAALIWFMLAHTAADWLLETKSLEQHIVRAAADAPKQVLPGHPMWQAAQRLFPEVYDRVARSELGSLATLPAWACPAKERAIPPALLPVADDLSADAPARLVG